MSQAAGIVVAALVVEVVAVLGVVEVVVVLGNVVLVSGSVWAWAALLATTSRLAAHTSARRLAP